MNEDAERRKLARQRTESRRRPTGEIDPEVDGIQADVDPAAAVPERRDAQFSRNGRNGHAVILPEVDGEIAEDDAGEVAGEVIREVVGEVVERARPGEGKSPAMSNEHSHATMPAKAARDATAATPVATLVMAKSEPRPNPSQPDPAKTGPQTQKGDAAPQPKPAQPKPAQPKPVQPTAQSRPQPKPQPVQGKPQPQQTQPPKPQPKPQPSTGGYDPAFDRGDDADEQTREQMLEPAIVSARPSVAPAAAELGQNKGAARTPNRAEVPSTKDIAEGLRQHVCPFCGQRNASAAVPCQRCGAWDNQDTRRLTTQRVGPWFLLRPNNPSAPGMRFSVLRELVRGGKVSAMSVVRGPATEQLWTFAARVRGLGHMFGLCWNCTRRLPKPGPNEIADDFCVYCGALLDPPSNPDQQLGAIETGESFGVATPERANQGSSDVSMVTATVRPSRVRPQGKQRASVGGDAGGDKRAPSRHVRGAGSAAEGADSLLSSRDLTTVFKLDQHRGPLSALRKLPLFKMIGFLIVAALVIAAAIFAWNVLGPWFIDG